MVSLTSLTVSDMLSGAMYCGSKRLEVDAVLPFFLVPFLLFTASLSSTATISVMLIISISIFYAVSRPLAKNKSPFFYSWTVSSILTMYLVHQFNTYHLTMLENFIFLILVLCTCYTFYKMKAVAEQELTGFAKGKENSPVLTSNSHYCVICQLEVNERLFHSIWWDCCVFKANYGHFLTGQVFAFATLLYGINLGLTTACHPIEFYGEILMPDGCLQMYSFYKSGLLFVSCIYGLGYLFVITLVLLKQFAVNIPKFSGWYWGKYANEYHMLNSRVII